MATNDTSVPTPGAEQPAAASERTGPRAAPRARAARARARRAPRARRAAARRSTSTRAPRTRVGTTTEKVAVTPIAQAQQLAERVVLIPLGAALEARDLVTDTVDELVTRYGSVAAVDRQLKRFERRGGRARTRLEREVRRTRRRLEREARHGRSRIEGRAASARRGFESRRGEVRGRVEPVVSRVESVVQNGVSAGIKLVGDAQDRLARVA